MDNSKKLKDGKHLIIDIKKQYPKLSKGQKLIAQYIISNYDKVAFMTTSKLAEEVGVSESTVVRFANVIGFAGYPKFQDALQELIKNKLTTVQRIDLDEEYENEKLVLKKVLKSDIENIKDTIDDIDGKEFEEATKKILKAKKIYIVGTRSSFVIAQYLSFYLNRILDEVHLIRLDMGDSYEQMVKITNEDLVLCISFPRYSKKSYQILSYAKEKGADIVSITDSHFAPVATISDNTLLVKSNMVAFVDSLVPALSLANALVVAVGMKNKDDIKRRFEALENVWDEYSIYQ